MRRRTTSPHSDAAARVFTHRPPTRAQSPSTPRDPTLRPPTHTRRPSAPRASGRTRRLTVAGWWLRSRWVAWLRVCVCVCVSDRLQTRPPAPRRNRPPRRARAQRRGNEVSTHPTTRAGGETHRCTPFTGNGWFGLPRLETLTGRSQPANCQTPAGPPLVPAPGACAPAIYPRGGVEEGDARGVYPVCAERAGRWESGCGGCTIRGTSTTSLVIHRTGANAS